MFTKFFESILSFVKKTFEYFFHKSQVQSSVPVQNPNAFPRNNWIRLDANVSWLKSRVQPLPPEVIEQQDKIDNLLKMASQQGSYSTIKDVLTIQNQINEAKNKLKVMEDRLQCKSLPESWKIKIRQNKY